MYKLEQVPHTSIYENVFYQFPPAMLNDPVSLPYCQHLKLLLLFLLIDVLIGI